MTGKGAKKPSPSGTSSKLKTPFLKPVLGYAPPLLVAMLHRIGEPRLSQSGLGPKIKKSISEQKDKSIPQSGFVPSN